MLENQKNTTTRKSRKTTTPSSKKPKASKRNNTSTITPKSSTRWKRITLSHPLTYFSSRKKKDARYELAYQAVTSLKQFLGSKGKHHIQSIFDMDKILRSEFNPEYIQLDYLYHFTDELPKSERPIQLYHEGSNKWSYDITIKNAIELLDSDLINAVKQNEKVDKEEENDADDDADEYDDDTYLVTPPAPPLIFMVASDTHATLFILINNKLFNLGFGWTQQPLDEEFTANSFIRPFLDWIPTDIRKFTHSQYAAITSPDEFAPGDNHASKIVWVDVFNQTILGRLIAMIDNNTFKIRLKGYPAAMVDYPQKQCLGFIPHMWISIIFDPKKIVYYMISRVSDNQSYNCILWAEYIMGLWNEDHTKSFVDCGIYPDPRKCKAITQDDMLVIYNLYVTKKYELLKKAILKLQQHIKDNVRTRYDQIRAALKEDEQERRPTNDTEFEEDEIPNKEPTKSTLLKTWVSEENKRNELRTKATTTAYAAASPVDTGDIRMDLVESD